MSKQTKSRHNATTLSGVRDSVSVVLNIEADISDESFLSVIDFLDAVGISTVYMNIPGRNKNKIIFLINQKKTHLKLYYAHKPFLVSALLKEEDRLTQIFQPLLFCGKNYFKKHASWGYPIFHFPDDEPEIYDMPAKDYRRTLYLPHPEDINSIFRITRSDEQTEIKNVVYLLERNTGELRRDSRAPVGVSFRLVVIRKCYLYFDRGLKYLINMHDDYLLSRQTELAGFNDPIFEGTYIDAESFFSLNNFISSGPEITRNYRPYFENHFKADLAEFWERNGNRRDVFNPKLSKMINTYIDGTLLPKFRYLHKNVNIQSRVDNPFFLTNLAALSTVYIVDDEKFDYLNNYFLNAALNLKRAQSYRAIHHFHSLPVLFSNLLSTNHSFEEKQRFIHLLWMLGVNKIIHKLDIENNDDMLLPELLSSEETILHYLQWVSFLKTHNQLLAEGTSGSEILVLFADNQEQIRPILETTHYLEKSGYDYDIGDISFFENDKFYTIRPKNGAVTQTTIRFSDRHYKIIILPGLEEISLKALQKIDAFVSAGGIVISLICLPEKCSPDKAKIKQLNRLIGKIWVRESGLDATSYKSNESSGMGIFQSNPARLPQVFESIMEKFNIFFSGGENMVRFKSILHKDALVVFLLNTGNSAIENIELFCRYSGTVEHFNKDINHFEDYNNFIPGNGWTRIKSGFAPDEMHIFRICDSAKEKDATMPIGKKKKISSNPKKVFEYGIGTTEWQVDDGEFENQLSLGDLSRNLPHSWRPVTYTKIVYMKKTELQDTRVIVSLGVLKDWCTLYWNNKRVATRLFPPWEFDVTNRLFAGRNIISIEVGHRLSNYIAGYSEEHQHFYPVMPYGLFGPVTITGYKENRGG